METIEEIRARQKAIDAYNRRRNALFGRAVYLAGLVKASLENVPEGETYDASVTKRVYDLAGEICEENRSLETEFEKLFIKRSL